MPVHNLTSSTSIRMYIYLIAMRGANVSRSSTGSPGTSCLFGVFESRRIGIKALSPGSHRHLPSTPHQHVEAEGRQAQRTRLLYCEIEAIGILNPRTVQHGFREEHHPRHD